MVLFGSGLVLVGLAVLLAGLTSVLVPLRVLKITRRSAGAAIAAVGVVLVLVGGAMVPTIDLPVPRPTIPSAPVEVPPSDLAAADATSALTCIQNALGGTAAFAAVSSLYIRAEKKPSQASGMGPIPGTVEISVVFPDRYLHADFGRPLRPGESGLDSFVGFDKGVLLSSPRHPDTNRAEASARRSFALQMLMRLPRKLAGVRLEQRVTTDSGRDRLAIEASGADGLRATLLADRETCVPIALQYTPSAVAVSGVRRVELSEYESFSGVRFPTVLKTFVAGLPYREERVTSIEVNTPAAAKAFAGRR